MEGKTRSFAVMKDSGKLHFKKEGMVNNQSPLDLITSKLLVTCGSICSIRVCWWVLDCSVMMNGNVGMWM